MEGRGGVFEIEGKGTREPLEGLVGGNRRRRRKGRTESEELRESSISFIGIQLEYSTDFDCQ